MAESKAKSSTSEETVFDLARSSRPKSAEARLEGKAEAATVLFDVISLGLSSPDLGSPIPDSLMWPPAPEFAQSEPYSKSA